MTDPRARAMTDQPVAAPTPGPWYWESVKNPGFIPEHTLVGPDVLCRYWHDKPPSADALLIAAAPDTAAERDRLLVKNAGLVKALEGIPLSEESCHGRGGRYFCPHCGEYGENPHAIHHNNGCFVPTIRAVLDEARKP